ncbi:conserved hypothetical protein [uncultured Desulfobacterium sp.]|uniref:DUF721 domain-containing protein n=1 Tax=uncultured Desulfobacterium sp. TaxID=201089 RepID=A0A445MRL2_9BACT|nr:conserved hypothetical protein [uncultured Desulfobacterium sp.]
MGDPFASLKDVISGLFTNGALPFNLEDARIWKVWDGVVGPVISSNATPVSIKGGQLRVMVSGPIWFQELQYMEEQIRNKLNEELGRNAVDKIEFKVGHR